jgi:hypothetical protein
LDTEIAFENYDIFRANRENGKLGGGVVLYVKKELNAMSDEEINSVEFEETVWCSINVLNGVCYQSPNSTSENNDKLLNIVSKAQLIIISKPSSNNGRLQLPSH